MFKQSVQVELCRLDKKDTQFTESRCEYTIDKSRILHNKFNIVQGIKFMTKGKTIKVSLTSNTRILIKYNS